MFSSDKGDTILGESDNTNTKNYSNFESGVINESGTSVTDDYSNLTDTDDIIGIGITMGLGGGALGKIGSWGKMFGMFKGSGDKSIVIGENMNRVEEAAPKLGAKVFGGKTDAENINFINNAMKKGDTIYDIGPDFFRRSKWMDEGRTPSGQGYNLERQLTSGYKKITKLWKRIDKNSGKSKY